MKKFRFLTFLFSLAIIITSLGFTAYAEDAPIPDPDVEAEAAYALDLDTGETVLSKNADEKMYPASTTKLMTALILAETTPDRNKEFRISSRALDMEAVSINTNLFILYEGDTIKADDLMKAILLYSANDMAVVAAEGVAGSEEKFVELMNNKAQELGLKDTHFENPVGLHSDDHYTTARDLALLMKAAYSNPWLKEVMAMPSAEINTKNQPIGTIESTNRNLGKKGNVAGKTGFTDEAGKCLVTVNERDGRTMILVLLKDGDAYEDNYIHKDMENFADEAFAAQKTVLVKADEPMDPVEVTYRLFRWFGPERKVLIKVSPTEDIQYYRNSFNEKYKKFLVAPKPDLNVFNLKAGDKVADISLDVMGAGPHAIAISDSTTFNSVFVPNALTYIISIFVLIILLFGGIAIAIKLLRTRKSVMMRHRRKRQERRRKITRFKGPEDL